MAVRTPKLQNVHQVSESTGGSIWGYTLDRAANQSCRVGGHPPGEGRGRPRLGYAVYPFNRSPLR